MDKHADGEAVAASIADVAADCGISLVASLPDGWITGLIERFEADGRFRHVAVNREESAIGLCSGAFFSGIGSLALMGASGFLTCIYAITTASIKKTRTKIQRPQPAKKTPGWMVAMMNSKNWSRSRNVIIQSAISCKPWQN